MLRAPVRCPSVSWCSRSALLAALALPSACGDPDAGAAPAPGGAEDSGGWETLVEGDWALDPGTEGYVCVRATIDEDTYISGFGAIAPLGTHHTLLTAEPEGEGPEETFDCNASTNGPNMLFGSGVGTNDLHFPDGVAVKLEQGSQVLLNLHLFNTSDAALTGTSGIRIQRADPADVEHEAEIILAGTVSGLTVEPGVSTQEGGCAMSHDVTVFAVAPHMHQLGTYLVATAEPASGDERVLVDAPYSFEEQIYLPVSPELELAQGDRISVECTYENPGTETVYFGDSSEEEMCFVGVYRYPKGDQRLFVCTEDAAATIPGPPCVEAGAPGNERGVGRHCTRDGGECGSSASLCLADFIDGEFANFCTTRCESDADCGDGASCVGSEGMRACFPEECAAVVASFGAG